jgi:hypothetical protein
MAGGGQQRSTNRLLMWDTLAASATIFIVSKEDNRKYLRITIA